MPEIARLGDKAHFQSSERPRAYICDECVAVCAAILEDHRQETDAQAATAEGRHPLLDHPLASSLMTAVEHWIRRESLGGDGALELAELRRIAAEMCGG